MPLLRSMDRMAKSIVLFPLSVMDQSVPNFFVYGEPARALDVGFMHVETVMERKHMHMGKVEAHMHRAMAQVTFWFSGRGRYYIEDQQLDFIAPAVSFVPSGVVHGFTVDAEEADAVVASIADSALPPIAALASLSLQTPVMVKSTVPDRAWQHMEATMMRLLDDYRSGLPFTLGALIAVALNDIATLVHRSAQPLKVDQQGLGSTFRTLVDKHFRENWPIERYVDAMSTTPHLLSKSVRAAFGCTPKAYIEQRRMIEAKRLLLFTVRSVEDIGYEVGFHDPAYFSRVFRAGTGQPPGLWRQQNAEKM